MRNFLTQLLGLPVTADRWLRLVHARISGIFLTFAIYLLTLGPLFNIIGLKGLNLIPLFAFVAAWTIAVFYPRALGLLFISNLPASPKSWDRRKIINDAGDLLAKIFGEIGIWPVSILFLLSTINLSNKLSAVWVIYGAAMILAIYTIRYGKSGKFFKRLAYLYALTMIILSLISLIPSHYQVKYFGFNLSSELAASDQEKAVSEVEEVVAEAEQDAVKKRLHEIEKRAKAGKLTDDDKKYLDQLIQERNDNALVHKISSSAGSLTESVIEGIKTLRSPSIPQIAVVPTPAPSYYTAPAVQTRPAPAVYKTPEKNYSGRYEICWERPEKTKCIRPYIRAKGDSLKSDYTNRSEHLKFDGRRDGDGKFSGDVIFARPGKVSSRDFSFDLENMSGSLEVRGGQIEEVKIKKLS